MYCDKKKDAVWDICGAMETRKTWLQIYKHRKQTLVSPTSLMKNISGAQFYLAM